MHHSELNMSSTQQSCIQVPLRNKVKSSKQAFLSARHIPGLQFSTLLSLPVKESWMFLAPRDIPLAQCNEGSQCFIYRFHRCVWRFAFCSIP